MAKIKILLLILFLTSIFTPTFARDITYTDNGGLTEFRIEAWNTYGISPFWDPERFKSTTLDTKNTSSYTGTVSFNNTEYIYKIQALIYPIETEDYIIKHQMLDTSLTTSASYGFTWNGYRTTGIFRSLPSAICSISAHSFNGNETLTITSNLLPFNVTGYDEGFNEISKTADFSNSDSSHFADVLNKYYNLKTTVYANVYLNGTKITRLFPQNMVSQSTLNGADGNKYINYSFTRPQSQTKLNFTNATNYLHLLTTHNSYGNYTFQFVTTPIDFKCDFDYSNTLSGSEASGYTSNYTLQVRRPEEPTLNFPTNDSNNPGTQITLNTTLIDLDGNNIKAYFFVDNSLKDTQSEITNGSTVTSTITNLTEGEHNYSIIVSDLYSNVSSQTLIFNLNNSPTYSNANTNPSTQTQFEENKSYTFSIEFTDDTKMNETIFSFNGTNYSYLSSNLTKVTNTFSKTFYNLTPGNYSYYWFANDTYSNENTTLTYNYTILKGTPQLSLKLNGTQSNITVEINQNVTINATLLTPSNGTIQLYQDGTKINENYITLSNITSSNILNDNINITLYFLETANFTSLSKTFYIKTNDITKPQVFDFTPNGTTSHIIGSQIEISTNATDNYLVHTVIAQITQPNGTKTNLSLTNVTSQKFNASYTIPIDIGNYTIQYFVNDTSSNTNNSETTTFTGIDTSNPSVTSLIPNSETFNISSTIEISANATDDISIHKVIAQITNPNSVSTNLTLTNSIGNKFNNSYSIPTNVIGTYNITFYVNDTSNNINQTETTNFTVSDNINPIVTLNEPTTNTQIVFGNSLNLSANVTDTIEVNLVKAIITLPNSTQVNVSLSNTTHANAYNNTYTPTRLGEYEVRFYVNDSSNNVNNSITTNFTVVDQTNPLVFALVPSANSQFNITNTIEISANATDDILVQSVKAIITLSNGTQQNLTLTNVTSQKFNATYTIPSEIIGRFNITIYAQDSTGNINNTNTTFFNVNEFESPQINIFNPITNSNYSTQSIITINLNATDNIEMNQVKAIIDMPNSTQTNLTLTQTENTFNANYTAPNLLGRFNITIYANDSSNNINDSTQTYFNVIDSESPLVFEIIPTSNINFNTQQTYEISLNATDNIQVNSAIAIITLANGTQQNLTLNNVTSQKFNVSYTIPNLIGTYNLTFYVNDTSNNINQTETTNFTVSDNINPQINILFPINGTTYNHSETIIITINATDNIEINKVIAQITYPNSTNNNLTISNISTQIYNGTFTIPALIGDYTITILANDSSNNVNNSLNVNLTVIDSTNPLVFALAPSANSQFNITNTIEISANATDDIQVNSAIAIITLANGTQQNLTLTNVTSQKFNASYTIPNLIGTYNITFYVNDTSNNINQTENTNFTVSDNINPQVELHEPTTNTQIVFGNSLNLSANVTDTIEVNLVKAIITLPNSTQVNISLSNSTYANTYNNTYTPTRLGTYEVRFFANDSSNNVNNSITTNFTVVDQTNPLVFALVPSANSQFNITNTIEISANATDDILVQSVKAIITLSNGTQQNLTLTNVTSQKFNASYTIPNLIGTYNITFYVNDTSNNINQTETTNFTVSDNINPQVTNTTQILTYNTTQTIEISANATDTINVNKVIAIFDMPNGTQQNLTLNNVTSQKFNVSYTIPNLIGTFNITFYVNDSSNNLNNSVKIQIDVQDNINPQVELSQPQLNTNLIITNDINLSINITDNIEINSAKAIITLPNSTQVNVSLSNTTYANTYNNTYTPTRLGTYEMRFYVNDSSNNVNNSITTNFTTTDTTNPQVINTTPISLYNVSETIEISANITDNIEINSALAIITLPNSTQINLTLNNSEGNKYNNSYSIPLTLIGQYNITFYANDSSNNINDSTQTYFNVTDNIAPEVFNLVPTSNINFNTQQTYEISLNATDNIQVNSAIAIITLANGTQQNLTLNNVTSQKFNVSYTIPNLIGTYNITFYVNDTSNNINQTETTNFTVSDNINPQVELNEPTSNIQIIFNNSMNLSINITDNIAVNISKAIITLPNSTQVNVSLSNTTHANTYNNTYTPTRLGTYEVRFFANDSSNNVNNSITTNFTVVDQTNPLVFALVPSANSQFNITNTIEIATNATDDIQVNSAIAIITLANGTQQNLTLTNITSQKFNASYTIPNLIGTYNITFYVNDTSNNINQTETTNFTVSDNINPIVTLNEPTTNTQIVFGNSLNLSANVTDTIEVNLVKAIITLPNSTQVNVSLSNTTYANAYNNTYTPTRLGEYEVRFFANDSSNNVNNSITTNFTVVDQTNPLVFALVPSANSQFNITNTIEISANATDDIQVNSAIAIITLANGTQQNLTLTNITSQKFNASYTIPNLIGTYNITFYVNDTTGNLNNSETTNFTASDNINPQVTNTTQILTYNTTQTIEISANATDTINVNKVIAIIDLPNSTQQTLTLTNVTSQKFNESYTIPNLIGTFNITFYVNDSSNNINNSVKIQVDVQDNINPQANLSSPNSNTQIEVGQIIELAVNTTDNIAVNNVKAIITLSNSTQLNQTLTNEINNKYNLSYSTPYLLGTHNITFYINDSSNNINNTITTNFTTIDTINPSVILSLPQNGLTFNVSDIIELAINTTDSMPINSTIAIITLPNSTQVNLTLSNSIANKYNNSYTIANLTGTYNVIFFVNDSSNNINNSITTSFTAQDVSIPSFSITNPTPNQFVRANSILTLNISATDNVEIQNVTANITRPDNTSSKVSLYLTDTNEYSNTFNIENLTGRYNVTYFVNDTSANNLTNSSYFIVTYPSLTTSSIDKTSVKNNSGVNIFVKAKDYDSLYAKITLPDSSINILPLTNNTQTLFSNTSQTGTYNIEIFVLDNATNNVTANYSFNSFEPITSVMSVSSRNSSSINTQVYFIYDGNIIDNTNTSNTTVNQTTINTLVTVLLKSFTNKLQVSFPGINLSSNQNKNFIFDNYSNSEYGIIYGINTTLNFTNATVTLSYNGTTFSNESNLKLYKCSNYDIENRICLSSFVDVTSSSTQNSNDNTFALTVTSFSAFAVKEVTPSPTVTSNTGGGSSGSGSSSRSSSTSSTTSSTSSSSSSETTGGSASSTCTTNWVCEQWSPKVCPLSGIQTRVCTNIGTCSEPNEPMPEISRTCGSNESKTIENIFTNITYDKTNNTDEISISVNLSKLEDIGNETLTISFKILDSNDDYIYEKIIKTTQKTGAFQTTLTPKLTKAGDYKLVTEILSANTRFLSSSSFNVDEETFTKYIIPIEAKEENNNITGNFFSSIPTMIGFVLGLIIIVIIGFYIYRNLPQEEIKPKKKRATSRKKK